MFEALPDAKPDAILALMQEFRADTRTNKLDLGVGAVSYTHLTLPTILLV